MPATLVGLCYAMARNPPHFFMLRAMFGPIFNREATVVPKRPKTYLIRGLYVLTLFLLLCTGYLVLDGSRSLATSGDSARFGGSRALEKGFIGE